MVERARERFCLGEVWFVADRGMVSPKVMEGLEERKVPYIVGVRMRKEREVRELVLSHPGRYQTVEENLKVKGAEAEIDEEALEREARYDGKYVLLTDSDLPAEEVALAYKGLWRVEAAFREPKAPLRVTRHGF